MADSPTKAASSDAKPNPSASLKQGCRCNGCGFEAEADDFDACMSAYHDMRCPKCGTTDIDTTGIFEAWAARGKRYGFGKNNSLVMR